ncbi:dipeptidase [Cryptosporangium minutisporangium]|uniref:Dipeptidase n=1 Tax=Cryptosporangium minutisporangium TaxID=113569 RepID=A0ABP6SZ79_9ACTN
MTIGQIETEEVRARISALMPQVKEDLARMVSFRSVADPKQYPPEECTRTADYLIEAFRGVGLTDLRAYETPDGSQAVYGWAPGPPGAPTVLLYCHYDVQPPLDEAAWLTPVFELTEKDGRWYGRGTADCKGNIAAHLAALRTLDGEFPVTVKLIAEGSEEQGTGGLEAFVPEHAELLRADTVLVCDAGNFAAGVPTLTTTLRGLANVVVTVRTLTSAMHSGQFGGVAPDALLALVQMLATLHDAEGNTTVRGLDSTQKWPGVAYSPDQFRVDANVREGVDLIGSGDPADLLWARPALTVLGIDCPPVVGSSAAVQPEARARLSLRVPPGTDAREAQDALIAHLEAVAPWHVQLEIERESFGQPFAGTTDGPGYTALRTALEDSYGTALTTQGQGGSIPLCNVLRETYPDAEIMILGVEEPRCLIHAPNESVDPDEIAHIALAEALFLRHYASTSAG